MEIWIRSPAAIVQTRLTKCMRCQVAQVCLPRCFKLRYSALPSSEAQAFKGFWHFEQLRISKASKSSKSSTSSKSWQRWEAHGIWFCASRVFVGSSIGKATKLYKLSCQAVPRSDDLVCHIDTSFNFEDSNHFEDSDDSKDFEGLKTFSIPTILKILWILM